MSLFNNPFVRVCTSGLGTGTTAGKAVGYTILLFSFAGIAVFYAGRGAYRLIRKRNASKEGADKV